MPKGIYIRTEKHKRIIKISHADFTGKNNPNWKGGKIEITCQYCGKVCEAWLCEIKQGKGKHCSRKCSGLAQTKEFKGENNPNWQGGKIEIKCLICGKRREVDSNEIKRGGGKYCSNRCSGLSNIERRIYKNTSIEIAIEKELKKANLDYQKQVAICKIGVVDFFLPKYDVIIECDGDYWHNKTDTKQRDATKNLVWMFNNYKVFRFWEHEINESPNNCIKAVLKYVNKIKFSEPMKIVRGGI